MPQINQAVRRLAGNRNSRHLILVAAEREFGRHGFAGARVDRIARSAGVNKQLIFYYFSSKAGLFEVILQSLTEAILAAARVGDAAETPFDELRATIARVWAAFAEHADLLRAALLTGPADGGASRALRAALDPVASRIAALVSSGQGLGYVRDDVEPRTVARQVLATALGHVSFDGVSGEPDAARDHRAPIELLLRPLAW